MVIALCISDMNEKRDFVVEIWGIVDVKILCIYIFFSVASKKKPIPYGLIYGRTNWTS